MTRGGDPIHALDTAQAIARAADSRKAENIILLDLRNRTSFCDAFVICSANNRRQVAAIADGVVEDMRSRGVQLLGAEGMEACRWVLLDFGDVLVHVFDAPQRDFYDLESLWTDAPRVPPQLAASA
jgi:ribosome-associated protein